MDNIVFERIYSSSFLLFKVTAQSEWVQSTIDDLFISQPDISALSDSLVSLPFPMKENSEYYWKTSSRKDTDAELSFKITQKDEFGHLLIEVYMFIKDGDMGENHHCRFFVQTEIGLLNDFGRRLSSICRQTCGNKISLTEDK